MAITARIVNEFVKVLLFQNMENIMKQNYAIIRQEKRSEPSEVNGIWAENIRSILGNNVDESRSHLNITLTPLSFENHDHFYKTRQEQIRIANRHRLANESKSRMPQRKRDKKTGDLKHSAMMQEFVFTHSNGALTLEESIRYCRLAHEFIKKWFDQCNVISSIIHLDETTPHIHIWTDYYDKFDNRFFQSDLQDMEKTDINKIRNAWQKKLVEEGFDLLKQDGSVVGEKHDGSKADKNKGDLKKQIVELKKIIKTLTEVNVFQQNENSVLNKELDVTKKERDNLKKEKSTLIISGKEKDTRINNFQKEINKLFSDFKGLKQKLLPWHKYIKDTLDMDVLKEAPPAVVKQESRIESTLQNKKVSTTTDSTIPSLL